MTRRYLLDSGPASDCIFRRRGVFERVREVRQRGAKVGIGLPILGEIVGGVEASATRDENWPVLERGLATFVLWPFDEAAAWEYGRLYAELRRLGRPMQQIDIQLAAIALSLGSCTVVTTDSDLSAVPGLRVEDWTAAPAP
ncbi:MAG: type II toxin-antitoxin system VapC family toxin [Gemmataceae bacterium]|nr:type II toxin-antitoxin system VapC family toxin [Gemmataceae bacterium]